jgi:hypothetical protein
VTVQATVLGDYRSGSTVGGRNCYFCHSFEYQKKTYHLDMRQLTALFLLTAFVLALPATAGHGSPAPGPTLIVSCGSCTTTEAITFSGTGYKAGSYVAVDVQGPSSYNIKTRVDSNGNINVDFGTSLAYEAGSYVVTAYAISGKSLTLVATAYFTVS